MLASVSVINEQPTPGPLPSNFIRLEHVRFVFKLRKYAVRRIFRFLLFLLFSLVMPF
jgi:hypothetical protein